MSTIRRTRQLSGALALVALALSLAEAGVASTCAPMASMDLDVHVSQVEGHEVGSSLSAALASDLDHDRRDPRCPLTPMMGPGCTAAASLRSSAPGFTASTAEHGCTPLREIRPLTSVSAESLFHPPRS